MTLTYGQAAASGILLGGLYGLMALGLSLMWGLLKVINLAHFALILIAAYVTYQVTASTGLDPLLTVFIVVPGLFVVGVAVHWIIEAFQVDELNSLLVTFGVLIIATQLISNIWSASERRIDAADNRYATDSVFIGKIALQLPLLMAFGAAVAFGLAIYVVLRHTYFGRALRALANDREIAAAFGVNHRRVGLIAAGVAAALAAVAGSLVGINEAVFPSLGFQWIGLIFTVVILGGIGNLPGAVAAGVLIGFVSSMVGVAWDHLASPLVTFLLLILALLFRPNGLFRRLGTP